MATVLFTWELGGGLGHLVRYQPIITELTGQGHRVAFAMRSLAQAESVFRGLPIAYLQAPISTSQPLYTYQPPATYPHILHNQGYADADELLGLAAGWRNLFHLIQPDLVLFDHSPTALLAARGFPAMKMVIGNGFFSPPDITPLPNLRPWLRLDPSRLALEEQRVLDAMNDVLSRWGEEPLERIGQLFAEVDGNVLTTLKELDHYPMRQGGDYWGDWTRTFGKPVPWPELPGKKIFAYLKANHLPIILQALRETGLPTVVFTQQLDPELRQRFASPSLRIVNEPVDMQQVLKQCNLAVLNATHSSVVSTLQRGIPVLSLPITLEQAITARNIARQGFGCMVDPDQPQQFPHWLWEMINSDKYEQAASQFAQRYAHLDPEQQKQLLIDRLLGMLG